MSNKPSKQPTPDLEPRSSVSFIFSVIFVIGVLLALPISQLIDSLTQMDRTEIEIIETPPPPELEQLPPPEDEQEQEEIEELEKDREPPTLEQLELSLNTDLSAIGNSDFTVPTIDTSGALSEIIYELSELTRQPRAISQQSPVYPPELRRAGISGTVVLQFVVRADGTTSNISVERSENPAFDEPAIRAVRRWRFEPGEKDGKAVSTRVRIPIPFSVNR